jgi:hypothetical protein
VNGQDEMKREGDDDDSEDDDEQKHKDIEEEKEMVRLFPFSISFLSLIFFFHFFSHFTVVLFRFLTDLRFPNKWTAFTPSTSF